MTKEAESAVEASLAFEGWKGGIKEKAGGIMTVPFDVKSEELPEILRTCHVGARFMVVVVPLADDETPKMPEKAKSFAGQAKMLSQDKLFAEYLVRDACTSPMNAVSNEGWIEGYCFVQSCSEITEGSEAGKRFKELLSQFNDWKQYG